MNLRKIMLATALVFCGVLALQHKAKADSIIIPGISKHLNTDVAHNERNWGIGYEHDDLMVAMYKNSQSVTSVYALYPLWTHNFGGGFSFRVPVGGVTGYNWVVTPIALPAFTYQYRHVALDFVVIPPVGHSMGILALQARIELGR